MACAEIVGRGDEPSLGHPERQDRGNLAPFVANDADSHVDPFLRGGMSRPCCNEGIALIGADLASRLEVPPLERERRDVARHGQAEAIEALLGGRFGSSVSCRKHLRHDCLA